MVDAHAFEGRCIEISAITDGALLFTGVEGYYLAGPIFGGDPDDNPNDRHRLGFYDGPDRQRRGAPVDLRWMTATGWLRDCETENERAYAQAAENAIVFNSGFCHYASGPVLFLSEYRLGDSVGARRLTGESMRARVGNFVRAPSDWPHRAFVEVKAAEYLDALRRNDRAALGAMHVAAHDSEGAREALDLILGGHAGFAELRSGSKHSQTAIFLRDEAGPLTSAEERTAYGELLEGRMAPDEGNEENYSSTICFCLTEGCGELWPISDFDADNREERPYVCTEFGPHKIFQGGIVPAFMTRQTPFGLAEVSHRR